MKVTLRRKLVWIAALASAYASGWFVLASLPKSPERGASLVDQLRGAFASDSPSV